MYNILYREKLHVICIYVLPDIDILDICLGSFLMYPHLYNYCNTKWFIVLLMQLYNELMSMIISTGEKIQFHISDIYYRLRY